MRMPRSIGVILILLLGLGVSALAQDSDAPAQSSPGVSHAALDRVLSATVSDGSVDYATLKAEHLPALRAYLDGLAQVDPAKLARQEQLAFYINLYNATVLQAVAERYRPDYSVSANDFALFKEPLVRLSGKTITLDELEKKIILPTFRDVRVHAVLVCGARSCPKLRSSAYIGEKLEQQLDTATRQWINDPRLNPVDAQAKRIRLSEIFKWYADDFGGAEQVLAWVDRYHEADLSGYAVEYEPYDWTLNDKK